MGCLKLVKNCIIFKLVCLNFAAVIPAEDSKNVCNTKECHISSDMLKSSMNLSVDPCTNFYQYACGGFPTYKKNKYDEDKDYDWLTEMANNLTNSVKEFLHSNISKFESIVTKKTKRFYQQCTNTTAMDEIGLEPIKEILYTIGLKHVSFGKFDPFSRNFKWFETAAKLKLVLGTDFLFAVNVVQDTTSSNNVTNTNMVLKISGLSDCMPLIDQRVTSESKKSGSFYSKVFRQQKFRDFVFGVGDILDRSYRKGNQKKHKYLAEEELDALIAFFLKRAAICEDSMDNDIWSVVFEQPIEDKLTFEELLNKTNEAVKTGNPKKLMNWEKYLKVLFTDIDEVNLDFKKLEVIVPEAEDLEAIIGLIEETSPRTLQLAIWLEVVAKVLPYTTNDMRSLDKMFRAEVLESPIKSWEDDVCNRLIRNHLSLAVLHHMLDDVTVVQNQNQAREMVEYLKEALETIIESTEWIDKTTQEAAVEKIKAMKTQISHPLWLQNDTMLAMYYDDLHLLPNNFLQSLILLYQKKTLKNLRLLSKHPESTLNLQLSEMDKPMMVNAFYNSRNNQITIPMGIMHRPFFDHPLRALNYGGLGVVIGHEITHGFDTTGYKFDKFGRRVQWWTNETLTKYGELTQCFIDSYNNITLGEAGQNVNGRNTLGENIADNGGVREALMAYRKYVKIFGDEPLLVGFENFSHEQLLSLAFANSFCARTTEEQLSFNLQFDEHSPHEARILGTFMNSQELADAWKCPKGSRMNAETKCRVW